MTFRESNGLSRCGMVNPTAMYWQWNHVSTRPCNRHGFYSLDWDECAVMWFPNPLMFGLGGIFPPDMLMLILEKNPSYAFQNPLYVGNIPVKYLLFWELSPLFWQITVKSDLICEAHVVCTFTVRQILGSLPCFLGAYVNFHFFIDMWATEELFSGE